MLDKKLILIIFFRILNSPLAKINQMTITKQRNNDRLLAKHMKNHKSVISHIDRIHLMKPYIHSKYKCAQVHLFYSTYR